MLQLLQFNLCNAVCPIDGMNQLITNKKLKSYSVTLDCERRVYQNFALQTFEKIFSPLDFL